MNETASTHGDAAAIEDPVGAIALLDEPKRRRLYEYVTARSEPVGRDEAAAALGIGRELAAFHLDRLAAAGLLDTEYRRLGGRTGPGAGRPAKLYRRSKRELNVSLPARDYERAAEVFADALERLDDAGATLVVTDVARTRGRETGREARRNVGARAGSARLRGALVETLGEAGYLPESNAVSGTIRLDNCPYHVLAAAHRDLTCGMNLAWAEGLLDGLGGAGLQAELAPEPGYCCVVFRNAAPGATTDEKP